MSLNQSRSDRNDSQYRKPGGGRSGNSTGGHNRPFSGGRGRGGAGPTSHPIPPSSTNRSYKKVNNAQGSQPRANPGIVNTPASDPAGGARSLESSGHVPPLQQGVSSSPPPAAIAKPADVPTQKTGRPLPRAPTSQSSSMNSDSTLPSTPAKGAVAKGFSLQFGTLSPGFMNGMQVPARTSSAPPNIDEQKHQARFDSSRGVPEVPVPVGPKQELLKKDAALVEKPVTQKNTQKTNTEPQANRDVQVATASPPTQAQKAPALPITAMSMPLPFHQPTPSMQFSGPNPQNQSQGGPSSSLQIPMQVPLHMANPPQVPQQVFVPGHQHHLLQTHGIMHQGQNLGYNPQLATQVPHQLGNIGINMPSQFNQPPNYGRPRTAVKITHPDTHEELRLDGRDGGPSRNQPTPTYTANPMGYYSNNYTTGPPVYPAPSSVPSTKTQSNATTQGSRFNYPVSQAHSNTSFVNQPSSTIAVKSGTSKHGNADPSNADHSRDVQNMIPPAKPTSTPVTIKAPAEKVTSSSVGKIDPPKSLNPNLESGTSEKGVEVSVQPKSSVVRVNQPPVTGSVPATLPAVLNTSPKDLASQQVDRESAAKVLKGLDDSSKTTILDASEATMISSSSKDDISEASRLLPIVTHVLPSGTTAVKVSANSSQSSGSCESQNVIEKASKQNDLPLLEDSTRASSTRQDRGEDECPQVLLSDKSLKISDALKGVSQDHQVKHIEKAGIVTETSQIEADSTTSDTEGKNMQGKRSDVCDISVSNTSSVLLNTPSFKDNDLSKSSMLDNEVMHVPESILEANAEHDTEIVENPRPSSSSGSISGSTKASLESSKTKKTGKKKLKELLLKADALGTTADLYMAYKGPEEKQESLVTSEPTAEGTMKDLSADANTEESTQESKDEKSKDELDDWEDADISSPKLESSSKCVHDEEGVTAKKYSRDFLLTISEHCTDLPEGFNIPSDVAEALMGVSTPRSDREYPSSVRVVDRPVVARPDRPRNGTMEAERWNKQPSHFSAVQDPRMDLAYGSNVLGFEGGRGPYGVLRHPRPQGPGGILSGPVHNLGFQSGPRSHSDERWLRATNYNRGLMPSPHTQGPVIHKAERKYEVGKITDEEQAKQRKLKGILNKLTPQNFERLFEQVKEVNIDNVITLTGVISQIFDKALTEPTFCEMYANFCQHLASELPDLSVDDEKITFRRLLLNKCQEEFERGEREEQEANNVDGEGDAEQSEAVREEKRVKARRRMLGNIRLIGELYKKKMLTERIMHECIKKLLGQYQNPDEENIEALCKLMSTIGEMIDHSKAKEHMDAYFDIMSQLSNNMKLSSRVRFMLKDAIDLRKNKWQQRRKVDGPKKIEEVHRDAAQERRGQVSQLNRGPSMSPATRRGPLEFGPRGSTLPSQIGPGMGFRGMPPQSRGFGGQDMRIDERNSFESRTLSMPLPQRLSSDEPITLGPQGGLARGMAFRGPPSVSSSPIFENSPSYGDPRRMAGGLNGYGTPPERGVYSAREDHFTRNASDRFGASVAYDQSNSQELNMNREVRYPDRNLDRSRPTTPTVAGAGATVPENKSFENVRPEKELCDMSLAAIKEFYSAKDEKEVALCIKDLNAPSFYPTVVSIWVSDSFERKNFEQDLLAKLLVSLTKPHVGTFSPIQLIQGFESVLTNLEETVTDAPKAPEFLGRILAKVVMENVLPLKDVGQIIQVGGEEAGRLVEVGLAGEVVASLLEMIKSEKGESAVNEIRASRNLQLENFRPPHPTKCHKLEMFI